MSQSVQKITANLARILLGMIFILTLVFSLYFSADLSWETLLWSLFKAAATLVVTWLFILVISDTIVKGIQGSVRDKSEWRAEGGLLFHFIPPGEKEIGTIETKIVQKKSKSK